MNFSFSMASDTPLFLPSFYCYFSILIYFSAHIFVSFVKIIHVAYLMLKIRSTNVFLETKAVNFLENGAVRRVYKAAKSAEMHVECSQTSIHSSHTAQHIHRSHGMWLSG